MTRNTELHYSQTPQIEMKRSKFDMSHSHKTTWNVGDVIPIYVDSDILPGDTVQMDMAELVRMATPIYPIMDNLYMDIYWFFCPTRLVYEHWQEFWGENDDPWTQTTEYEIPQITAPEGGWKEGTIADYMGIPTKVDNISVNAIPFRSLAKIWSDWFRDENLKSVCHVYKDETTRVGQNGDEQDYSYITGVELGGKPPKAAKMHDRFTSSLPEPQKGPAVTMPMGNIAPIKGDGLSTVPSLGTLKVGTQTTEHNYGNGPVNFDNFGNTGNGTFYAMFNKPNNTGTIGQLGFNTASQSGQTYRTSKPVNLYAEDQEKTATLDLNSVYVDLAAATAPTINALRTAFAVQKFYENAALHGSRYIEFIQGVFGVTSSDARLQRSEYLGGTRVPINIDQILQTSATNEVSPQGNTSGFSCTINRDSLFTKSFEEHGTLMCLVTIRTEHTYQQGLKPMWTRKKWLDFYNPFFANLGNAPVYNREIYAQGTDQDNEAFGYQEAWADYRTKENFVSGYMRSNANGSLDVWHFADDYETMPYLSSDWIDEPYTNVDRTIAVTSALTHQFIGDFYFKAYYTRPMPVYSVPGLIDHV